MKPLEFGPNIGAANAPLRWAVRVCELVAQWRLPLGDVARDAVLAELWTLLNLALQRYVRAQARRFGPIAPEDVVDLAADKTLELLRRLDRREWDPALGSHAQLCGYLFSVARNGVVDHVHLRGREVLASDLPHPGSEGTLFEAATAPDPESAVDGSRYARGIVECAALLSARARLAWMLRVFHGMSSAQIGHHPQVGTSPGGVDLILNRSRRRLRKCMQSKGLEPNVMPPGTFAALWEIIDAERSSPTAPPELEGSA